MADPLHYLNGSSNGNSSNGNGIGPHQDDVELSAFIPPTDEAQAVPQPSTIKKFWVEDEYKEAKEEQCEAHAKKGKEEARAAEVKAAGLAHEADKAEDESNDLHAKATSARQRHHEAEAVLGRHARRLLAAKFTYWLTRVLILGGDIAGIGGAALLIGEEPIYALLQATSAAVSAITLGGIGRELRYLMAARIRQKAPEELSEEEQGFESWFTRSDAAEQYVKMVALACATGIMMITGGIFALRNVAEGIWPAIAFSGFAMGLGLASFYNSFTHANEIAEHLDAEEIKVKKKEKKADRARKDLAIQHRAQAKAEAESIVDAHAKGGKAAAYGVGRSLYQVLTRSSGVAGHGPGA